MWHGDFGRATARPAVSSAAASVGAIYRPSYSRRALAHVATGSLPPLPLAQDFAALTLPAVAALLGFLAGVRL